MKGPVARDNSPRFTAPKSQRLEIPAKMYLEIHEYYTEPIGKITILKETTGEETDLDTDWTFMTGRSNATLGLFQ